MGVRELLDLIADYVAAREADDGSAAQALVARFDVALGEAVVDYASVQNEA